MGAGSSPCRRRHPAAKKNKQVELAPEADVQNDIDDIDVQGKCKDFLSSSVCKDLEPGEGAVANCISEGIAAAEVGEESAETVPDECQEDVYQFMITRGKNINANLPLAKACQADAEKLCKNTWVFGPTAEGRIIACLREEKGKLSKACAAEVFKMQMAIATDYRADPELAALCKADIEQHCKGIKDGGGRVTACLRSTRAQLRPECAEAVFRQELEADEDLRLNIVVYKKCLADKKTFCPHVPPGNARARDCLVAARNEEGFSSACRDELEAMIEARVRDFRIDARLRRVCKDQMQDCIGMDIYEGDETIVNICLQDNLAQGLIPEGACKNMVYEYQQLAAQDIRFDVPLADACHTDRQKLCGNVPPGSARVIRCLQTQRDKLSSHCRAEMFNEEVRFSENIDFQYPMKQACLREIDRYCKDVPHGQARVIRCLQENKGQKEFGKACLKEMTSYEQKSSQDYRFNFRLASQCKADIKSLCSGICKPEQGQQVCGGTVLRCLTEMRDQITSEGCRKEVLYFEKMEVSNFNNDVILAANCRGDVDKFCKNVEPGEGRVHACLREHRRELSDACRREEMILEQQEAEHIELRPNLLKACADERQAFCAGVAPGSARVFRCLAEKLADPDFGPKCRYEVIAKLQRRQANWKLDPMLRRACRSDVDALCKSEDAQASETGEVYRCLVHNYDDLDPNCKKELGRAVHMAFFIWSPNSIMTRECDADVQRVCLKDRPNMDRVPGQVGTCLADVMEQLQAAEATSRKIVKEAPGAPGSPPQLSDECKLLADVAEPPNMKRAFETTLSVALLESQLSSLESKTGLPLLNRDRKGNAQSLSLTGWTAIAGMAAMVVLVAAGGTYAWRQYKGVPDSVTVVLKSAGKPRYNRVASSD
ncbi:hypothetical protein OEZ85_011100 [Tetradesmus obliquus]|uniref:Golgi apparatus protein 1 n=1 Tax=Tetradesmus obliquus TaxID=3088 RepID=A0ABY8TPG0_TETOB|nr:hypothetical protein OEZ85_011100 [Tetradesmus obliquus]